MKRVILTLIVLLLCGVVVHGQSCVKVNGYAQQGGQSIVTSGISSTTKAQKSFPSATVTVYNPTGTTTLASIYSNNTCTTPKSNPFTAASSDASFGFYIAPSRIDIRFSGTGITSPFTISDIIVPINTSTSGGPAGGDLSGTYPNPTVTQARGLRETSGPTTLTLGATADGQFLKRSGTTVIGGTVGSIICPTCMGNTVPIWNGSALVDSNITQSTVDTSITVSPAGYSAGFKAIGTGSLNNTSVMGDINSLDSGAVVSVDGLNNKIRLQSSTIQLPSFTTNGYLTTTGGNGTLAVTSGPALISCSGIDDTSVLAAAQIAGAAITLNSGTICASNSQTLSIPIFYNGGMLKPLNSQTLTLTGGQYGTNGQRFTNALSGQGTISFGSHQFEVPPDNTTVIDYYAKWWGVTADGSTNDAATLRAAVAAVPNGCHLILPAGRMMVTDASVIMTLTRPIWIQGVGGSTQFVFKTATAATVPLFKVSPESESHGALFANMHWRFSDFFVGQEGFGSSLIGGDVIQIAPSASDRTAYYVEVEGLRTGYVGGYDVHVANNSAGSPISTNATLHLHIHDNPNFNNGVFLDFGSDSFTMERNTFIGNRRALEATFITGAANVTIANNTFATDLGVLFHNGFNVNIDHNYFEVQNPAATGADGALLSLKGDVAQIKGCLLSGNLFVSTAAPASLNGVKADNVKLLDVYGENWWSVPGGQYGLLTTASTVNMKWGVQNAIAGSLLQDNTTVDTNGVFYSAGYPMTFAGKPAHPYPGTILQIVDGTVGSNPLTGGGAGCAALYQGGAWKSL